MLDYLDKCSSVIHNRCTAPSKSALRKLLYTPPAMSKVAWLLGCRPVTECKGEASSWRHTDMYSCWFGYGLYRFMDKFRIDTRNIHVNSSVVDVKKIAGAVLHPKHQKKLYIFWFTASTRTARAEASESASQRTSSGDWLSPILTHLISWSDEQDR